LRSSFQSIWTDSGRYLPGGRAFDIAAGPSRRQHVGSVGRQQQRRPVRHWAVNSPPRLVGPASRGDTHRRRLLGRSSRLLKFKGPLFGFELEAGTDGPKKSCNNSGAKVLTPEPFFGVVVVVNFLMLPLWLFMSPFLNPPRVTVTTHTIDPASGCLPTSFLPFITSNFFFFVGTSIILFYSPSSGPSINHSLSLLCF
jgi:hypothetical protein